MNSAAPTADRGFGMVTGNVKGVRNVWGDGGYLFACRRVTFGSVKMAGWLSKSPRLMRPRAKKNAGPNSKLGIVRKIADDVRRPRFIWEIPARDA